eukprot:gnl/TRDRNA2_/TRDRNA2_81326_c0_seq1.p1 gnl/TRDRNA2_/TRDRNA2_81326_c0~~gnl/TRDRNA2_/TRDRNA2_81326_c0_seq1.p1  ORF type:complete len:469 (-),score=61.13 gnl/TRDRNA2_/TRDRNA2_81326_c0_seq1:36-1385(-)
MAGGERREYKENGDDVDTLAGYPVPGARAAATVAAASAVEGGAARSSRWSRAARLAAAASAAATSGAHGYVAESASSSSVAHASLRQSCPICLEEVEASEDAGLPCGHAACSGCIVRYVESRVDSGQVSPEELSCPLPSCRMPMPETLIAHLLRNDGAAGVRLHERLLDFQARRFVPDPGDGERLVTCPSPGCGRLLVPSQLAEEAGEVSCPLCSRTFCAGCEQPAHPGRSCEAAEEERMDPELRKLIDNMNWTRCPVCRNLCERESGCNFMTCPSEQCKSETHFCYLCGELLTKADHARHYEGFDGAIGRVGPFGSVCANKRTVDLSLPVKPPAPRLGVIQGEGTIVLRITWGEHRSSPPTIYYWIRLKVPNTKEVRRITASAGEPHHDFGKSVSKYKRYQATVTPVNVNGQGPESEPSDIVHFHEREVVLEKAATQCVQKSKRWATR